MVRRNQRDGLGRDQEIVQAGPSEPLTVGQWSSKVECRDLYTVYPLAAPPLRLVREEELAGQFLAEKSCHPRTGKPLMHLREEWHRGGVLRTSAGHPKKTNIQPLGSPLEPYPHGGPGKHSRHFRIRFRHCYHPEGRQRSRIFLSRKLRLTL